MTASTCLGNIDDHLFVAALSNTKGMSADRVVGKLCLLDNGVRISNLAICKQEDSLLHMLHR